jgi:hypothetical protein
MVFAFDAANVALVRYSVLGPALSIRYVEPTRCNNGLTISRSLHHHGTGGTRSFTARTKYMSKIDNGNEAVPLLGVPLRRLHTVASVGVPGIGQREQWGGDKKSVKPL